METTKKLSVEIREKILASSDAFQKAIAATKAASADECGTFEIIITTEAVDRAGEIVKADGLDISDYMKNPIGLWAHDYSGLPVAITDSLEKVANGWKAKGRFCPKEVNPMAQQVRAGYDFGVNRTASIGFMDLESEGNIITKSS